MSVVLGFEGGVWKGDGEGKDRRDKDGGWLAEERMVDELGGEVEAPFLLRAMR